jgi:hypothetical protein
MPNLGLYEIATHADLRVLLLPRARAIFVAVALWVSTLLFFVNYVFQMRAIKLLVLLSAWALLPIGARAAGEMGLPSHKIELYLAVWLTFYLAFLLPRLAYPISVSIYLSVGGEL